MPGDKWDRLGDVRRANVQRTQLSKKRTWNPEQYAKYMSEKVTVTADQSAMKSIRDMIEHNGRPAIVRFSARGQVRNCSAVDVPSKEGWVYLICHGAKSSYNGKAYGDDILIMKAETERFRYLSNTTEVLQGIQSTESPLLTKLKENVHTTAMPNTKFDIVQTVSANK
tara:strand:+ start:1675 stop:2178 length:504 start_codon:yes stop_codon:yes gene_type:complete